MLSLEQPFRINDWIRYDDTDARVVKMTWRTTHLRTRDNDDLVVPNARLADGELLNYFSCTRCTWSASTWACTTARPPTG